MKTEYRVVEYYNNFFAHTACRLQKHCKFLWWSWWETVSDDSLGLHGYEWSHHYDCPIVS